MAIFLDSQISGSATSTGSFGRVVIDTNISESSPLTVDGTSGRLFTVTDQMSGSVFSANLISGLPVIEAFSDNKVKLGPFSNPVTINSDGTFANVSGSATSTGSFGKILVGGSELASSPDATDGSQSLISGSTDSTGSFGRIVLDGHLNPKINFKDNDISLGEDALLGGGNSHNVAIGYRAAMGSTSGYQVAIGYLALSGSGGASNHNVAIGTETLSQNIDSNNYGNTAVGGYALQLGTYRYATAVGYAAAQEYTGTSAIVAIGYNAARAVPDSNFVAIGDNTLNTTGSAANSVAVGISCLSNSNTALGNYALGANALQYNTTGKYNVAIGRLALQDGTTASNNIAIGGYGTLMETTTGGSNIAVGKSAMEKNLTGISNIAIGGNAMRYHTDSDYNLAIGINAMQNVSVGTYNVALGYTAGYNTGGDNNVMIGQAAGYSSGPTTVDFNVFIGYYAGRLFVSGSDNVGIGKNAMYQAGKLGTNATDNVAVGENALYNAGGLRNVGIGLSAMSQMRVGNDNVAVGYGAGQQLASGNRTSGSNSVYVGQLTKSGENNSSNEIVIGSNAIGKGTNTVVLGDDTITDIYMSEDVGAKLHTGDVSGSATSTGSFGYLLVNGSAVGGSSPDATDGSQDTISGSAVSTGSFGQLETVGDLIVADATNGFKVDASVSGHTELKLNNRTIFVNDDIIAIGENVAPNDLAHQKGGGAGGRGSVYIGNEAGENVDNSGGGAANNTFIGNVAGQDVTSGIANTFVGANAGGSVTTGNSNVIIGRGSPGNADIDNNILIGVSAGTKVGANGGNADYNIILGNDTVSQKGGNVDHNIIMGYRASRHLGDDEGSYNVHLGYEAASNVVTASYNVAIGYQAMEDAGGASSGGNHVTKNVAIGYRPLVKIDKSGNFNIAIGVEAANNNTTGSNNIVMGYRAAYNNSGDLGQNNIFMGTSVGNNIDGGDLNVCLGKNAGAALTTANDNILIGQGAGFEQTTGNHIIALGKNAGRGSGVTADTNASSIFIGQAAYSGESGATNETVIGTAAIGKGSNTVVLGDDNVTDIYLSEDKGAIVYGGTFSGSAFIDDGTQLNVPDYVFEPEYDLKSLEYVETHISQSKHLPGVPSRDDKEGWVSYDMGGRDMLLLEKIEELTLYIIDLEKRIKILEENK